MIETKPGLETFYSWATVWDLLMRTCSTRRSSLASTSMRTPSRSTDSPALGTRPSHSLTRPPTVVDSMSSSGWKDVEQVADAVEIEIAGDDVAALRRLR